MKSFGAGQLYALPTTGNLAANPTPQQPLSLQDSSVEFSQKLQSLMGANKFPDDVAPSDMKITGKATFGNSQIDLFNNLFFAGTVATGITANAPQEPHAVPASSPYTVSVTNSANFNKDQGVIYAATGFPMTRVSGSPTQGQYAVSAGVYTFAAADDGQAILISYNYLSSATGRTLSGVNQIQGFGPAFELYLYQPYQGENGLHLFQCRSSKLNFPLKRDNYTIIEFDFEAYANAAGQVYEFFQTAA